MAQLLNHHNMKFGSPRNVEVVTVNIAAGVSSSSFGFSRLATLGDIILLYTGTNTSVSTTTPTGFTLLQTMGSSQKNYAFRKEATASEGATYPVAFSSTVDTKTIIAVLIRQYNSVSIFDTLQSKTGSALASPQDLITTPFAALKGEAIFVHVKLNGNFRSGTTLSNGFTVLAEVTSSLSMQSFLAYKSLTQDDAGVTTSYSYSGGSTGFLANWIILKPKQTN